MFRSIFTTIIRT